MKCSCYVHYSLYQELRIVKKGLFCPKGDRKTSPLCRKSALREENSAVWQRARRTGVRKEKLRTGVGKGCFWTSQRRPAADSGATATLRSAAPRLLFLPITAIIKCLPRLPGRSRQTPAPGGRRRPPQISDVQFRNGARAISAAPASLPPAGCQASREVFGEQGEPSPAARARTLPGAGPRFRGFENFPARVPRRRAAAGPEPTRPAPPAGNFSALGCLVTLAFRRASPSARAPRAPSLPPGEDLPRRPRLPSPPPPPLCARPAPPPGREPPPLPPPRCPASRFSKWPGPVPRPDSGERGAEPRAAPGAGSRQRGAGGGGGEEGTRREGLAASFEPTFRQWSKATCPSRLPQRRRRWRRRSRWNCWRPRLPRGRSERPHR